MFSYERLSKRPAIFRSFTNLDVTEFDSVYDDVESRYHDFERKRLSGRKRKNEVEQFFPGFKAFVDSTEQEIPRPKKDAKKRKTHYSGKKKRHTVKTRLAVNAKGLIVHKTDHARGRRHDLDLYRQRRPGLPKEVEQYFDGDTKASGSTSRT